MKQKINIEVILAIIGFGLMFIGLAGFWYVYFFLRETK